MTFEQYKESLEERIQFELDQVQKTKNNKDWKYSYVWSFVLKQNLEWMNNITKNAPVVYS